MTKKELKIINEVQARKYAVADSFKKSGNQEMHNAYIDERCGIDSLMTALGYTWNSAKEEFEKVVENE